jgi:hypothetical protein
MEGSVFDQRDVGDGGAARHGAFEQVVAQHEAFGQACIEHRMHGLHVEQALAGVGAFAEHVLVDLGAGRAVGVDAGLAGEQPVKEREVARGRQGRRDARLQDAVAADDATRFGVDQRPVVRVSGHAHQLAQSARWQLRVTVESDDVGRVRGDLRLEAEVEEQAGLAGGQHGHQLFDLAALALPADPALFGVAEAALAVQQDEARRFARPAG